MSCIPARMSRLLILLLLVSLLSQLQLGSGARRRRPPPSSTPLPVDHLLDLATVPSTYKIKAPSSTSSQTSSSKSRPVTGSQLADNDLVYATGSCRERMHLAKSSRSWRRGVRAFILTDHNSTESLEHLNEGGRQHNEAYAFFPDDRDPLLCFVQHGTKRGDTRAAVAPFAAHRFFGETYKWLLYGDDDTLFFLEPVKRMLSAYDHNLPLAFSDNLWAYGQQPNPNAPRCLPCHLATESLPTLKQAVQGPWVRDELRKFLRVRKPNITEEEVDAAAGDPPEAPGRFYIPRPVCPYCTPEGACPLNPSPNVTCLPPTAHGGAGMIFSVGLLRSLPYRNALECIRSFRVAPGGDYMVSQCLWRHNVAFTDPGPLVRHLYDPHYVVFGAKAGMGFLFDPIGSMTHGRCNSTCRWMLRNTLTLHLKGRHYRTWRVSSILMWGVANAVAAAQGFLDVVSKDGGASWRDLPYGFEMNDSSRFAQYESGSSRRR